MSLPNKRKRERNRLRSETMGDRDRYVIARELERAGRDIGHIMFSDIACIGIEEPCLRCGDLLRFHDATYDHEPVTSWPQGGDR